MVMSKLQIFKNIGFLIILLSLFWSCCKNENPKTYDKVIILYMAANNNLDSYAVENITMLKSGYVPDYKDPNILILFKHISGEVPSLIRLYKDDKGNINEELIKSYLGYNSASSSTLQDVLLTVKKNYYSLDYGLILWSHSTGWLPKGYFDSHPSGLTFFEDPFAGIVKSFGYDRGEEIELTELADAIPFKLSFIIFDACFNGGIETVYEFKNKAEFIVASPTEILATGFPYDSIILPLFEDSDLNSVCEIFYDYYTTRTNYNAATISIFKTSDLPALAQICRTVFQNNRNKIASVNLSLIQPYFRLDKHWFYDMEDFIVQIASPGELLVFRTALSNVVIGKWHTDSFLSIAINRYSGISTYVPNPPDNELDTFYKLFKWNIDTGMIQ